MKKILFINETCGTGSHGKICLQMAKKYEENGYVAKIAYGRFGYVPKDAKKYAIRIGNALSVRMHALYTRIFDRHGFGSLFATKKFLKWLDNYSPNIIWIHNIHGYYINIELLFDWLKKHPNVKIKWTLHDCWPFTGHCSHFMAIGCEKWKTGCYKCPQKNQYPKSIVFDSSRKNYIDKKRLFTGPKNIEIITPCQWLADKVKDSFLGKYDISVDYNKIDRSVFRKKNTDLKEKLGINNKILLSVANRWTPRKGLYDLVEFSKRLSDDYTLIVIGIEKKQINLFDKRVRCIRKTNNQTELSCFYSIAEWFLNFTYEDTYPTVNLEAEACGTPVITYDSGGARETIKNNKSVVVRTGDYDKALQIIQNS